MKKSSTLIIKTKTINEDTAKQYFTIVKEKNNEPALIIKKLILSKNIDLHFDFRILKKYKNKYLFATIFSIKIKTLNTAID